MEDILYEESSIFNTEIKYEISKDLLFKLLKTDETTYLGERAIELVEQYKHSIKPKYIFKKFYINSVTEDTVTIENEILHSKALAKKLLGQNPVYIYIATCGKEIDEITKTYSDPLDNYIMDQISYSGYLCALNEMHKYMSENLGIEKFVSLSAGSVPDWSVGEVIKIFNLLGDDYKNIGINVLGSGLIDPLKSTSGILYVTEESFHSCEICRKENCPNREAPFDEMQSIELLGIQGMTNC